MMDKASHIELQELFALRAFRRFLLRHFEDIGFFVSPMTESGRITAYNAGKQDGARIILTQLAEVDPEPLALIMKEKRDEVSSAPVGTE